MHSAKEHRYCNVDESYCILRILFLQFLTFCKSVSVKGQEEIAPHHHSGCRIEIHLHRDH